MTGVQVPTIGRIVHYRTRDGIRVPAIVTATTETNDHLPEGVAFLTSPLHVHLHAFLPPGMPALLVEDLEDVPHADVDPRAAKRAGGHPPCTWTWPERAR